MPSGTDAGDERDEDVHSLLASEDGVPARLELDAEAEQAAEPAPAAQRRPLKPRAEQVDQHRRDDRLDTTPPASPQTPAPSTTATTAKAWEITCEPASAASCRSYRIVRARVIRPGPCSAVIGSEGPSAR